MSGDSDGRSSSVRAECLLLSPAVGAVIGLAEWAAAGLGRDLPQSEASQALVGVVLLYAAVGLPCGVLASVLAGQLDRPRVLALSLPPAAIAVAVVALQGAVSPVLTLAALAFGWVALRAALRVADRLEWLASARIWWSLLAVVLAAGLALSSREAPDGLGSAAAVGACGVAALAALVSLLRRLAWPSVLGASLALAITGWLGWRATPVVPDTQAAPGRPSVLLVTIDTLRADRVGVYGHEAARTPIMDGLAEEGTLFRTAVTQAIVTGPSHASILTGLIPGNHGVVANEMRLRHDVPTLADTLRRHGYATGAFVGGLTVSQRSSGLPARFAQYDDWFVSRAWFPREVDRSVSLARIFRRQLERLGVRILGYERPAADTVDLAREWLDRNGETPFFTWVHMYDPHLPYHAPEEYLLAPQRDYQGPAEGDWYLIPARRRTAIVDSPRNMQHMLDLYDAEIAYSDDQLGRLVAAAREAAPDGNLVVVVTSDHGESMGEHRIYWHRDLYDPTLLVPLIIVAPPSAGDLRDTVDEQVRLIDLVPTVLELVGVESEEPLDGTSLLDVMREAGAGAPGPSYTAIQEEPANYVPPRFAVRHAGWKLIHRLPGWERRLHLPRVPESRELYELGSDPGEMRNAIDRSPEVLPALEAAMKRHAVVEGRADRAELTAEERDHMRSLGYTD